ncbi:GNAT family N-acetyltransferase, partial [Pseudomonas syringae pv. tagetis]
LACVRSESVHVLPLIGLDPEFQGQKLWQDLSEQLLGALHDWCALDDHSQGIVLDTGNPRYLVFSKRQGYEEIGEIAV